MKKIILIIAINILLAAGQLGLAIGRTADGVAVSNFNEKWQQLRKENQQLAAKVYTKSSLTYIASKSAQLGLAGAPVHFVSEQVNVAAARLSP